MTHCPEQIRKMQNTDYGVESATGISGSDENILNFLDSTDSYLILMDSFSSALRQGWFELATARQSMGASRVNSALFDLKSHNASTTLQVHEQDDGSNSEIPQHFTLCKWACSDDPEKEDNSDSPRIEDQGISPRKVDNQAEKERLKSLSVFGKLISPKLRATQSSFEKALEMLVEISNVRASLLYAHHQVHKDMKNPKPTT